MDSPVATGEAPEPWISDLAAEAAWQAWKHRGAEIAQLRAELARCGKDNCMGRRCDDVTNWVTEQAAEARVAAERARWEAAQTQALGVGFGVNPRA